MQHLISHRESIGKGGPLIGEPEQVLVRDDDQGINIGLQFLNTGIGLPHADLAFEIERLGDNANGQDTLLTAGAGDHRGSPGSGSATHTGGDEHHVAVGQLGEDIIDAFLGSDAADFGL